MKIMYYTDYHTYNTYSLHNHDTDYNTIGHSALLKRVMLGDGAYVERFVVEIRRKKTSLRLA